MVQQGYTPLIVASTLGDVELVELLLEAGATLEVCDPVSDGSPMMAVTIPSLLVLIAHTIIEWCFIEWCFAVAGGGECRQGGCAAAAPGARGRPRPLRQGRRARTVLCAYPHSRLI